jgi:hypothetical protein
VPTTSRPSTARTWGSRTSRATGAWPDAARHSDSTASGCCTRARSTRQRGLLPPQDDYDHAELILDAYDYYTSAEGGAKGAVMLGDEMIDEASRKMALVISAKGRAAGMARTQTFA